MNTHFKYTALIVTLLMLAVSCEKKVDLKIKEQAKKYPVIFGLLTDDPEDNTVSVSISRNYDDKDSDENTDVVLKMAGRRSTSTFTKTGNTTYRTNQKIQPGGSYTFTCIYNSTEYTYATMSGLPTYIYTVRCTQQSDGNYKVTPSFIPFGAPYILSELFIGTINNTAITSDTTWVKYNDYFPSVSPKINFLNIIDLIPDSMGMPSFDIVKNAPLNKNDLVKVKIYSLDFNSLDYLKRLNNKDNYLYDPLSIAPPINYFAFSNEALGIIIPALVSSKVFRVP